MGGGGRVGYLARDLRKTALTSTSCTVVAGPCLTLWSLRDSSSVKKAEATHEWVVERISN